MKLPTGPALGPVRAAGSVGRERHERSLPLARRGVRWHLPFLGGGAEFCTLCLFLVKEEGAAGRRRQVWEGHELTQPQGLPECSPLSPVSLSLKSMPLPWRCPHAGMSLGRRVGGL